MKTYGHLGQFSLPKWNTARSWVLFQTYCQVLREKAAMETAPRTESHKGSFLLLCRLWIAPSMVTVMLMLLAFCLALNKVGFISFLWYLLILILTCFSQKTWFYPTLSHLIWSVIFLTITTSQLGVTCKFTCFCSIILEVYMRSGLSGLHQNITKLSKEMKD